MSADIYLQCFEHGKAKTFSRLIFEEVFARDALAPQYPLTRVSYPDGGRIDVYGGESDDIHALTFSRYGGEFFFRALYELADRTQSIIYWPDILPALAVTNAAVIPHIPADCLDAVGPAEVIADTEALMDYVSRPE
jgi:hypothetical protein